MPIRKIRQHQTIFSYKNLPINWIIRIINTKLYASSFLSIINIEPTNKPSQTRFKRLIQKRILQHYLPSAGKPVNGSCVFI